MLSVSYLDYPLLTIIQLVPLLGAVIVYWLRDWKWAMVLTRIIAGIELLLAIVVTSVFDSNNGAPQLSEQLPTLYYHVAVDGVTVLFILLIAFITLMLTIYSLVRRLHSASRLSTLILATESVLMVMVVTLDLFWFTAASAAEIVLVALFLNNWSTAAEEDRALAMIRFLQFQGAGLFLLSAGAIMLAWNHADRIGRWSFDLADLVATPLPARLQSVVFFLLFYGLALRTPLFPLHGWLPHVVHRGTVALVPSLLLGVKTGIYGMVRFLLPLTPHAAISWRPYVVGVAMTGVFYAAILAFLQTNLRRLLSFAVISHTSLMVIGLFTLNAKGMQGAVLLSATSGLAVTVMLFMVGFVFRRARSTDLDKLGGLFERIPFVAATFFIAGLSTIGMPGTPSFDAVHLVLDAVIERFGTLPAVTTALGNVVAAGFLLWAFQKAFLAPLPESRTAAVDRTLPIEYLSGIILIIVLLVAGFYVEPWLDLIDATIKALVVRIGEG